MSRVLLVHWHEAEGRERRQRLVAMGHQVTAHWRQDDGGALTRSLTASPPEAVIVDLTRLPSHGRAIATWLRERKALRRIPIVFVPGDLEKTERLRSAFPDAHFVAWSRMRRSLPKAIVAPVADPVVPAAPDYSGTPLPKKLGLQAGGRLCVLRPPPDFANALGELQSGAIVIHRLSGTAEVIVLFCRALTQLRADWPNAVACLADKGSLWVAWPKKASGQTTDLSDGAVRAFGLDQGLVDTKVCAIDVVWSGLRFSRRAGTP